MVFLKVFILLILLIGCASQNKITVEEKISSYSISKKPDQYSKVLSPMEDQALSKYLESSRHIAFPLKDNILYIRLFSFYAGSASDIEKDLKVYNNTENVILDLRDNGGGLLDEALKVLDLFIDRGMLLKRKEKDKTFIDYVHDNDYFSFPLVILVNDKSASASEIVAGVLQEKKRALIVGSQTFGKGSIQDIGTYRGTAFKVTTAYYYLPSGKNLNNTGVIPDIEILKNKIIKISSMCKGIQTMLLSPQPKKYDSVLMIGKVALIHCGAKLLRRK